MNRAFSQIDTRVKFFAGSYDTVCKVPKPGTNFESIMTLGQFNANIGNNDGGSPFSSPPLFRDLGKSVTILDAMNKQYILYRRVQLMSGASSEGVSDYPPYYVVTWSADPDAHPVTVTRAG